jgi:hypothetical protein
MSDSERRNKGGRPRRGDLKVDYLELDRLLVHGEEVPVDGKPGLKAVRYPSYQELADRYGVSISVVGEYSTARNCLKRRAEAQARLDAQVDQKIIAMRAEAIALSRHERIGLVDRTILTFDDALKDGRVRCDTPADLNVLLRLREYLEGGADSRQQILGGITLELLQSKHREVLRMMEEASAAERGIEAPPAVPAEARLAGDVGEIEDAEVVAPEAAGEANVGHDAPPNATDAGGNIGTEGPGHEVNELGHEVDESGQVEDSAGVEWPATDPSAPDSAEMHGGAADGSTPRAEEPAATSSSTSASSSSSSASSTRMQDDTP